MNIALVLSGGKGRRAGGGRPKQYVEAGGVPVISFCLDVFERHERLDAVWIVAEEAWQPYIRRWTGTKFRGFSGPGETRQLSVVNGLEDILRFADPSDIVLIHDAARPFASEALIDCCLEACRLHEGVMPVLPVRDTMYVRDGGRVASLLDRGRLCAGQTPEAFVLGRYYEANRSLFPDRIRDINGSTEAAFLGGLDIAAIPGEEGNFKLTTAEDMERFCRMAEERRSAGFVGNGGMQDESLCAGRSRAVCGEGYAKTKATKG